MKSLNILIILLLLKSTLVYAADKEQSFSLKGAGLLTCSVYSETRKEKSELYYLIAGWLEGYTSAYNHFSDETYDITSFETTELLTKVLANHCTTHPKDRIYTVFNSVLQQLRSDRIKTMSDQKIITVGKRQTHLYVETITRIQLALKDKGFYTDEINNSYTVTLIEALKKYQASIEFEVTGFPDQTTLWRLLRK